MTIDPSRCRFAEGSVTLPDNYHDRTLNVFSSDSPTEATFNIARDQLQAGENLAGYIDRQLSLMEQHFKGWKTASRTPVTPGENLSAGECITASYEQNGQQTIHQQQAIFPLNNGKVLVFTVSRASPLTDKNNAAFQRLLTSFKPVESESC